MKILKCIIVDDEELARTLLENYISKLSNLELVAKCKNPLEAMTVLQSEKVDLMFLDIQMPELTGVEFLKTLNIKPMVVFTTAYAEYALEGYALDVVDYLLKPFGLDRFIQAVNKAIDRSPIESEQVGTSEASKKYRLVKSEHKIHKIFYEDIIYIQSMREYVAYYTSEGRILSLGSLKSLELELPEDEFIRIHKSYIVPIQKIKTLEGNMVHVASEKLPIGAIYKEAVLSKVF
jgi:DNA-binding LytR/AlgR family response regulator